ncbi:ubiquitin-conjugating enzyme E2 J2 [Fistulifera solaris]|uniref:E2 ubiquitin-conjugating enzyme n=1 Tax=Fistulifera solaris TaxID=1519565 RepID=A0A1Z5KBG4_FISSO|nr:ubiquitin-conjugating enzyme E2 J2 [Fistulifera solaris]|eukprot:GAX23587.1 ubiquitin-conjugating enzyme E2 J2 [Fistulifera solaris]
MATDICIRRLTKELAAMQKDPIKQPKITVAPNESNMLEMHYVIEGSTGTPYEGGVYHGKLIFPKQYPLKPPGVMMLTPSGRFQPNRRLCLSMSDFHPESWNPMWSVSTILTGLYSFMLDNNPTLGSIETSTRKKRQLAEASLEYNVKNDPIFCKLFPHYVERYEEELRVRQQNGENITVAQPPSNALCSGNALFPRPQEGRNFLMATMAGVAAILSIVVAVRFL